MFGVDQARRYHDELFALFDLIAANPRIARERNEIEPPVRIQPFKAHLIVYRVEEGSATDGAVGFCMPLVRIGSRRLNFNSR